MSEDRTTEKTTESMMNHNFPVLDSVTVAVPEGAQLPLRFKGKTVVITGAASEIGKATALQLGLEGANLVLIDSPQQKDAITALAKEIPSPTLCYEADITKPEDVQRYVAKTIEKFGAIHGFFNNTSLPACSSFSPSEDNEESSVFSHRTIDTRSIRIGLKYVSQAMKKQRKTGTDDYFSIVNASSASGNFKAASDIVASSAAGFALVGITLSAAKELAPHKIRVNAVSSGAIEGKLSSVLASSYMTSKSFIREKFSSKRGLEAEEVAKTVAFLLSNDSVSLTGSNVPVCHADKYREQPSTKRRKTIVSSI